jgi:hypothetical protein
MIDEIDFELLENIRGKPWFCSNQYLWQWKYNQGMGLIGQKVEANSGYLQVL